MPVLTSATGEKRTQIAVKMPNDRGPRGTTTIAIQFMTKRMEEMEKESEEMEEEKMEEQLEVMMAEEELEMVGEELDKMAEEIVEEKMEKELDDDDDDEYNNFNGTVTQHMPLQGCLYKTHVTCLRHDFSKLCFELNESKVNAHSFIHCRHLYSTSSSGTTQKRSQPQHGQIMLF